MPPESVIKVGTHSGGILYECNHYGPIILLTICKRRAGQTRKRVNFAFFDFYQENCDILITTSERGESVGSVNLISIFSHPNKELSLILKLESSG